MKKSYTLLLSLFIFFGFSNSGFAANTDSTGITAADTEGLKTYLAKIPAGSEKNYGFNSVDEFALAKVGAPIHLFTLAPSFFSAETIVADRNYINSIDQWLVPVMVNGECRAIVTVSKQDEGWKAVAFGSSFFATELNKVLAENSGLTGQSYALLRIYQLNCDFIIQPNEGETSTWKVTPFTSAKKAFKLKDTNNAGYLLPEVYDMVKHKAKSK